MISSSWDQDPYPTPWTAHYFQQASDIANIVSWGAKRTVCHINISSTASIYVWDIPRWVLLITPERSIDTKSVRLYRLPRESSGARRRFHCRCCWGQVQRTRRRSYQPELAGSSSKKRSSNHYNILQLSTIREEALYLHTSFVIPFHVLWDAGIAHWNWLDLGQLIA